LYVVTSASSASPASEEVAKHSPTATEHFSESREDVFGRAKSGAAFNASVTVAIVASSLFGIANNLIRFGSFFELCADFFVTGIAVRMILNGQLAIRFRDTAIRLVASDAEHFVIATFGHD
jgi:hypothetical protein